MEDIILKDNPLIPTMILQTIVENAIVHGIVPIKRDGEISITIYKEKDVLHIKIFDNGLGFSEPKNIAPNKMHKSKGLKIIRERLASYEKLHNKTFSIRFNKESNSDDKPGTTVLLTFPYLYD